MLKHQGLIYYLFHEYGYAFDQEEIGVDELIYLFRPFKLNPQAVRVLLSRLKSKGIVSNRRVGKKSYYFLTEQGKQYLTWGWGQIFHKETLEWNGKWRIVIYNIPEKIRKKRDEFRLYLMFNRYASLNSGIWICPEGKGAISSEQLLEKVTRLGLEEYVQLFTADNVGLGDNIKIVDKAYNLERIIEGYTNYIQEYGARMEKYKKIKEQGKACQIEKYYVERFKMGFDFLDLIKLDPKLPPELLPSNWNGLEAEKILYQYGEMLREPTYSYFGRQQAD